MNKESVQHHLKSMFHLVFQDLADLVHRQAAKIDKQDTRIEEQSVQIKVRVFLVKAVINSVLFFYHIKCPICNNLF